MKDSIRRRFVMAWLCSALIVAGVRFFHAVPMSLDLALQIQAAQNLLAGKGLSIYSRTAPDLAAPSALVPLTTFPSGYSFYTAAILALRGNEATAIRLLAAASTMLGWWGWAILAYPFFGDKMNRAGAWKWAGFLIALSTPLLFTITWGGTDIFLWAAVPWVLTWVLKASTKDVLGGTRFDVMAGAVCGLAILMRYASIFLTVYAAFLILWQSRLRPYVLTRRSLFFAMGLVPFLAVQLYINEFLTSGPPNPGGLSFQFGFGAMVRRALEGLPLLTTANFPWAFWFPGIALDLLFSNISRTLPWQLAIILASYVFLALSAKIYGINLNAAAHDSRVASMGLFIAFPLLLWACMMMGTYNYLGNQRYYWPLLPLGIFVVYSVASFAPGLKRTGLTRVVQAVGGIYIIGYVALSIFYIASFFGSGERGALERSRLIGSPPGLSLAIAHELSPARKFVVRRVKEEPDTLLLASSKTGWFVGDNALDRSRVHELSCRDNLKAPYVTGPARIIFLTYNEGKPLDLWGGDRILAGEQHPNAACFEQLPGLTLLQLFPDEGLKVLEARVPAGTRIKLLP